MPAGRLRVGTGSAAGNGNHRVDQEQEQMRERSRAGVRKGHPVPEIKMKAVMKYPGSKWGIAGWIISFFPEHHSYLEPFFGSGTVLFNKPRSNIETVSDPDGNVVNLFGWIKKDPERLAYEIYYTPYARQVYMPEVRCGKQYKHEMFTEESHKQLLETAKAHKGPVLISGYESDLYNDMLQGWHREETTCYSQACSKKKEVLWMNFEPVGQMSIEDIPGVMP